MSLDDSDEKIALLQEIRDEVRGLRDDTHRELGGLRGDIHGLLGTFDRGFDRIEAALADCAEQVRLTVHYTKVLCKQRGIEIEPE